MNTTKLPQTTESPAVGGPVERMVRPLPKTQQDLLDAMRAGVRVVYMPYAGWFNPTAYFFRSDTHKRVTAAANALIEKGLAKRAKNGRSDELVLAA